MGSIAGRYRRGDSVWVSPSNSGEWVCDDEAVILEDLGSGYLILQESERIPSYGQGHFVCDLELSLLFEPVRLPQHGEVLRERRLWEFNAQAVSTLGPRCDRSRQRLLVHN